MYFHPNYQLYFVNHNKKSNKIKYYFFIFVWLGIELYKIQFLNVIQFNV
jgi:hypothetical protein